VSNLAITQTGTLTRTIALSMWTSNDSGTQPSTGADPGELLGFGGVLGLLCIFFFI